MGAKITLKGRLGGEPTYGETREGKPWISFSLRQDHMVRSGKKLADGRDEYVDNGGFWMQVVWFSRKAEKAAEILKKGAAVVVSGDLRAEQWESKETGELQSGFKVVADEVSLDFIGLESVTYQSKEFSSAPTPRPNIGKGKSSDGAGQAGAQNRSEFPPQDFDDRDDALPF